MRRADRKTLEVLACVACVAVGNARDDGYPVYIVDEDGDPRWPVLLNEEDLDWLAGQNDRPWIVREDDLDAESSFAA